MAQSELSALHGRAMAELGKIPGVLGVGYGIKETGGQLTGQAALRVYVAAKKPAAALAPNEQIPAAFEGVVTDVLVPVKGRLLPCEDTSQPRPLIGGITITNFKPAADGKIRGGTLGFFATVDGGQEPKNIALVSNNHVLMRNGAVKDDRIYNPEFSAPEVMVTDSGFIAKIDNIGKMAHHNFDYPGEGAPKDYFVDCASARLDISISSWCKTNCGITYKNEIRILDLPDPGPPPEAHSNKIKGCARVVDAQTQPPNEYVVYKVGRQTSRTKGKVKEVYGTADLDGTGIIHGVMIVVPTAPDCDGIMRFCDEGDSGSAVLNEQRELVGILFGGAHDNSEAWVSHLDPVLDVLKVTPISQCNQPLPPAGKALADVEGLLAAGANQTSALRDRFLATPKGTLLYETALAHSHAVIDLVNHRRPVTLAWHRGKGPAFLAHTIENVRDPAHRIPRDVEGVTREALLRRMAEALSEHGRPPLAAAIAEWLPFILTEVEAFDSLHDLVSRLEPEAADG
jgi:hypothetical protein